MEETSTTWHIALNFARTAIIATSLLFNLTLALAYILMRAPLKQKINNICFFNQSIADLTIIIPLSIQLLVEGASVHTSGYLFPVVLYSIYIRIGSLLITSLYTFLILKLHSDHWKLVSVVRLRCAIVCMWCISTIPALKCGVVLTPRMIKTNNFLWKYTACESSIIFVVVFIVIFVLLGNAMRTKDMEMVYREQRPVVEGGSEVESMHTEQHVEHQVVCVSRKMEGRAARVLFGMCVMNVLMLLPLVVGVVVVLVAPHVPVTSILPITYLIYTTTSIVDPLLIMYFHRDFINALKEGFQTSSSPPNVSRMMESSPVHFDL